jgi:hypothetical protein
MQIEFVGEREGAKLSDPHNHPTKARKMRMTS